MRAVPKKIFFFTLLVVLGNESVLGIQSSKPSLLPKHLLGGTIHRKRFINHCLIVATTATTVTTTKATPTFALSPIISNTSSSNTINSSNKKIFREDKGTTIFTANSDAIKVPTTTDSINLIDAIEILQAQRIACDNIVSVISNGDLNEATFKGLQLVSQIKMGGKVVLESLQQGKVLTAKVGSYDGRMNTAPSTITSSSAPEVSRDTKNNASVDMVRYLQCQKKFALLIDVCDEFNIQLEKALRGKLGVSAVAQIQLLALLDEVRNVYDQFLTSVDSFTS